MKRIFDVLKFGAAGDGAALDTQPIQRAIDAAAADGGKDVQVLLRGKRRYRIGTLELKGAIDFHLAEGAELLLSTDPADYRTDAAIVAHHVQGLRLSGEGAMEGQSRAYMDHYDQEAEIWREKSWRPKMLVLTGCRDLEVRDLTLRHAPIWTLHLVGCEGVLVDHLTIRNQLDVPNCDGIDPDHCRNVEIRNCNIACGDDAIVIKSTRQAVDFGPCANIIVKDCVLETQDSGIKIGTETTQDIHDIRFERCRIKSGCRGLCIQLRDEGNVFDIDYRDITFIARYHSAPWWGRGEAISLTAIPRTPQTSLGSLHDIRFYNIQGRAENSVRIHGTPQSRIRNVRMEEVALTLDRWTTYPGGVYDNRPTRVCPEIEPHATPAISLRHADQVRLERCRVEWGRHRPDYFTHALEARDVRDLQLQAFSGEAAHPRRDQAVVIVPTLA